MKIWLGLAAMLLLAMIVAACAGNQWAAPADLLRAIEGDQALRSRLLHLRNAHVYRRHHRVRDDDMLNSLAARFANQQ